MNTYFDYKAANRYTDYPVREPAELMTFLMNSVAGASRTKIKQMLAQRMVYVDKVIITQYNHPLRPGQLVQVSKNRHMHTLNSRWVRLVYEDAFIIVVEKHEGILTNALPGSRGENVKAILDEYVKRTNPGFAVHTVHRLDRCTSGLLLFAKRRDIQQRLTDQWHDFVTDRRYVAVVQGSMERDAGTVTSWLTDNKMFVTYSSPTDNGGKQAITHYRTLKRKNGYSLMELKLDTGRKNQIRVHMQDLGHPIVGDFKYGSTESEYGEKANPVGRVCLHAFRLAFRHPVTGEPLRFETPYPSAFTTLLGKAE